MNHLQSSLTSLTHLNVFSHFKTSLCTFEGLFPSDVTPLETCWGMMNLQRLWTKNWKSDVIIFEQPLLVIQVQAANPGKSTSNSPSNVFNIHVEKSLRSLNVSYGISIFLFELENCILISIDPCGSSGGISNYDLYHSIITWLEGGVRKKSFFCVSTVRRFTHCTSSTKSKLSSERLNI